MITAVPILVYVGAKNAITMMLQFLLPASHTVFCEIVSFFPFSLQLSSQIVRKPCSDLKSEPRFSLPMQKHITCVLYVRF